MLNKINVTSEIGNLKRVMLHRPGREIENLVPEYLGRLLFDDIPYLKVAVKEHDAFADTLIKRGVEVCYLEDMTADALTDMEERNRFIDEFLSESGINSKTAKKSITEYLLSMPVKDMVDTIMAGIRKEEISISKGNSLMDMVMDNYPFLLDPMPNLYFTRDPGAAIGNGISINMMRTEARRRETLFLKYVYKKMNINNDIPLWYDRSLSYPIEGGDILVLSKNVLAIGFSERTAPEAIQSLAEKILGNTSFERILVFDIPKCRAFMHLDTVFTMIDYDKFTIHPAIKHNLGVYEIIKSSDGLKMTFRTEGLEKILSKALKLQSVDLVDCGGGDLIAASREQWNDGSNTLAIAPGVVITYDRNYVTNEILDKRGIKVLEIPSSEISRGRGGPRCMSMPLYRDDL